MASLSNIQRYDLDKFYQFPYGFHLVFNVVAVIVQYIIISEYKSVSKKRTNKQIKGTKQCDKVCFEQDGHQTRQLRSIYNTSCSVIINCIACVSSEETLDVTRLCQVTNMLQSYQMCEKQVRSIIKLIGGRRWCLN